MNMETILCKEGYILKKNKKNNEIINELKKNLKVTPFNPFQFMNKNKTDDSFNVYTENDEFISIPKFYGIEKFGKPIVDKSLIHLNKFNGGLISVGCGKGKTCMSLYIACKLKVKTLVIVHKTFLLNQWIDRIKQFTSAEIGIIQQKKIDIEGKDIVIGMLQSIAKGNYDNDIFKDFGFVIFDEAHHAPSKYFSQALPIINCKKSLALSATPKRSDKLEKLIFWYLGPLIYKSPPEENKDVLVKMVKYNLNIDKFREYKLPYNAGVNRPKTLTKLCQISKRNKFIVKMLKDIMLEEGRKILILSDRIEHLELIKELLEKKKFATSDFYIGGRKQKDLDIAAEAQILLATFSMASEALDIPELNTLFMVTSRREIEQSVGRILRKKDHPVQPLIIDMVDQLKSFVNQSVHRKRFYKRNNYQIKLLDVDDNKILSEEDITNKKIKTFTPVNNDDVEFID